MSGAWLAAPRIGPRLRAGCGTGTGRGAGALCCVTACVHCARGGPTGYAGRTRSRTLWTWLLSERLVMNPQPCAGRVLKLEIAVAKELIYRVYNAGVVRRVVVAGVHPTRL